MDTSFITSMVDIRLITYGSGFDSQMNSTSSTDAIWLFLLDSKESTNMFYIILVVTSHKLIMPLN